MRGSIYHEDALVGLRVVGCEICQAFSVGLRLAGCHSRKPDTRIGLELLEGWIIKGCFVVFRADRDFVNDRKVLISLWDLQIRWSGWAFGEA